MTSALLDLTNWRRAMTLAERIASPASNVAPAHTDTAQRRLRRWRSQPPFASGKLFALRLASDGIDEDTLMRCLSQTPQAVEAGADADPPWLVELVKTYGDPAYQNPAPDPETPQASFDPVTEMLSLLMPLVRRGRERLNGAARELIRLQAATPFDPDTVAALFVPRLQEQLLELLSRTLALELNAARLQGALVGETNLARFLSFVRAMNQPDAALALLDEYPVLARMASEYVGRWIDSSVEFLRHLCQDWDDIHATFRISPAAGGAGPLAHVSNQAGDTHHGGRAVTIATFASGLKLVYKPRSLSMDVHFQDLLAWLNARSDGHAPFRLLTVLDQSSHGWVEFVNAGSCEDLDQVRRFFRRQGGYLAILYAFQATDFHFENIIAAGEHPVLIDLESLFHPRLSAPVGEEPPPDIEHDAKALFRSGLLPRLPGSPGYGEGLDLSGLGGAPGQFTTKGIHQWDGLLTDEMRLVCKPAGFDGGHNRPSLHGQELRPADHIRDIVEGFSAAYQTLGRHRAELLSAGGLLDAFAGVEVRVILRRTQLYANLLDESFHPDYLRDAIDRDRLLDRLWAAVEKFPSMPDVVRLEREDLAHGDLPRFTTRPTSKDLFNGSGATIRGFLNEPAMAQVRRRLRRMDEQDLSRQLEAIIWSITGQRPGPAEFSVHGRGVAAPA